MHDRDICIWTALLLQKLNRTWIVVHAGNIKLNPKPAALSHDPDRQVAASGSDIQQRPSSRSIPLHHRKKMAFHQAMAGRKPTIDRVKLLERVDQLNLIALKRVHLFSIACSIREIGPPVLCVIAGLGFTMVHRKPVTPMRRNRNSSHEHSRSHATGAFHVVTADRERTPTT